MTSRILWLVVAALVLLLFLVALIQPRRSTPLPPQTIDQGIIIDELSAECFDLVDEQAVGAIERVETAYAAQDGSLGAEERAAMRARRGSP